MKTMSSFTVKNVGKAENFQYKSFRTENKVKITSSFTIKSKDRFPKGLLVRYIKAPFGLTYFLLTFSLKEVRPNSIFF